MPMKTEHACDLADSAKFDKFRRGKRKHEGKEYGIVFGRPKGGGGWQEVSYRYSSDVWKASEAKGHCKDHEGTFVEAKPQESFDGGGTKSGQRIARRNLDLLEEAEELLSKVLEEEGIPRPARALITSAQAKVKSVIKDGKREGEEEEEGKSLDVLARQIAAGLFAGKRLSGSTFLTLFRMLEPMKAQAEAESRREVEERVLGELLSV